MPQARRVTVVSTLLLVGCGAKSTPPQQLANHPHGKDKGDDVGPSCANAARRLIQDSGLDKIPAKSKERARLAGEAEARATCLEDEWPDNVLVCMAARAQPSTCLGQLEDAQQEAFRARLIDWQASFGHGPAGGLNTTDGDAAGRDDGGDDTGDDADNEGQRGGVLGGADWLPCSSYGDLASYDPALGEKIADREYAVALRQHVVRTECEMMWTNDDKQCFAAAKDGAAIAGCRAKLADNAKYSLTNRIGDAAAKYQKVVALEKSPKQIDCKAVAAVHYGDEAWRNILTGLAPGERKRVMEESRTKLAAACASDKWSTTMRACLVGSVAQDTADCYPYPSADRWGFPALGVTFKSGIAECDHVAVLVGKVESCTKFDQRSRDELLVLLVPFTTQLAMWIDMPTSNRDVFVQQCTEYAKLISDGAKERGCKL
jgi:hypothetical protein